MDATALTDAIQRLTSAQVALLHPTRWLILLVLVLAVVSLGGFLWLGLELRAIRQVLAQGQANVERIAAMTAEVLRRTE
jgi:hypothetical protein